MATENTILIGFGQAVGHVVSYEDLMFRLRCGVCGWTALVEKCRVG